MMVDTLKALIYVDTLDVLPMVEFRNVSFGHHKQLQVLDVSFLTAREAMTAFIVSIVAGFFVFLSVIH